MLNYSYESFTESNLKLLNLIQHNKYSLYYNSIGISYENCDFGKRRRR